MNQHVPVTERFWARVTKAGPDECWLWTGGKNTYGYGILRTESRGRARGAHRYSWELHHGAIPDGMQVLHKCDVRNCVNPAHLFLGSNQQNTADKMAKGRHVVLYGENQIFARLKASDIPEIRRLYAEGLSQGAIGEAYGVGRGAIGKVVRRTNWKHVE